MSDKWGGNEVQEGGSETRSQSSEAPLTFGKQ